MKPSFTAVSLFSLPFDLGGNPGASLGADRISEVFRRRFSRLGEPAAPRRWKPWAGRAWVREYPYRLDHTFSEWAAQVGAGAVVSVRRAELPVFVGGNHLALAPVYDALLGEMPDLWIVSLDAHHDLGDGVDREDVTHGSFWLNAVRPETLARTVWIGPRTAPPEGHGDVAWVSAGEWSEIGSATVLDRLGLASRRIVLDIDLDVLDAAVFPATVSRAAGGLSWLQVAALVRELARRCEVRCVGMAEYNPLLDDALTGSLAAASDLLLHVLDVALPEQPHPASVAS